MHTLTLRVFITCALWVLLPPQAGNCRTNA